MSPVAGDGGPPAAADRGAAAAAGGQGAATEVPQAAGVPAPPDGLRVRQTQEVGQYYLK